MSEATSWKETADFWKIRALKAEETLRKVGVECRDNTITFCGEMFVYADQLEALLEQGDD